MPNPESRELPVTKKPASASDAVDAARGRVLALRLLAASTVLALPFESDANPALYEQIKGGTVKGNILNDLLTANIESNDVKFKISGWKVKVTEGRMDELEGSSIEGELVWANISPDGNLFAASIKLTTPSDVTLTTSCCGPKAKPKNGGARGAKKGTPPQETSYRLESQIKPYDSGTFLAEGRDKENEGKTREEQGMPHSYEVSPRGELTFYVTSGPKDLTLMLELYPEYERNPKDDPIRSGETRNFGYDTDFEVVLNDKDYVVVPGIINIEGKPFPKSIKVIDNADGSKTASAVLNAPIKLGPIKIPANSGFHEITVKVQATYFVILKGAPETESESPYPALDRDVVEDPEMPAQFDAPLKVWRDPSASNGYRVEFLADNTEVENGGEWRGFKVWVVPDGFPNLIIRLSKGEEGKNDYVFYDSGRVVPEYFRQYRATFRRKLPAVRSTDPTGPENVVANFFVKPVTVQVNDKDTTRYEAELKTPEAFAHRVQCQVNHVMRQGQPAADVFCREKTALRTDSDQESQYRAYRARLDTRPKAFGASGGADRKYRLRKY